MNPTHRPLPEEPMPWSRPFWDGTKEGRLLLPRCRECEKVFFFPRAFCPSCHSEDIEWIESSGRGTIYTYTTVRTNPPSSFTEDVPFIVAIVRLEEGVQIMSNIVDVDDPRLACDAPVEVLYEQVNDDVTVPLFRLTGESNE